MSPVFDLWLAIEAAGLSLQAEGGRIRARPAASLTDELRAAIRTHRGDLLAGLAARPELARLLELLRCGPDHPDHGEALALALANPAAHLECFRASARAEGLL